MAKHQTSAFFPLRLNMVIVLGKRGVLQLGKVLLLPLLLQCSFFLGHMTLMERNSSKMLVLPYNICILKQGQYIVVVVAQNHQSNPQIPQLAFKNDISTIYKNNFVIFEIMTGQPYFLNCQVCGSALLCLLCNMYYVCICTTRGQQQQHRKLVQRLYFSRTYFLMSLETKAQD